MKHDWKKKTYAIGDGMYSIIITCSRCGEWREWVGSNGTRWESERPSEDFYDDEGCKPILCDYCGDSLDTKKVYVQTNPQERNCCERCWEEIKFEMLYYPMAGGGVLSSEWEDDE